MIHWKLKEKTKKSIYWKRHKIWRGIESRKIHSWSRGRKKKLLESNEEALLKSEKNNNLNPYKN